MEQARGEFGVDDLDTLVSALRLVPDLRLAARLAVEAKARLKFPVLSANDLAPLLSEERLEYRGHTVDRLHIAAAAEAITFPIHDVHEFVRAAYIAILQNHHDERMGPFVEKGKALFSAEVQASRERVAEEAKRGRK